jgi:DNA-binding transcriptional ArsR family regulator
VDNPTPTWSFLTNHSHVLLCISEDPDITVRDLALQVGITERAVMRIIGELDEGGVITRTREGRRNHYTINGELSLRHPVESHCTVADLILMFKQMLAGSGTD